MSKKEKLASIRKNKSVEKELHRQVEKIDLATEKVSEKATVIDFATKEKINKETPKKSSSRLMDKLRKKRDEEFGKDK